MFLQDNRTALIWAAFHGQAHCVRLLLDAGADKNAKDKVRGRSVGRCTCVFFCICICTSLIW
jgi:hypothetical protein